MTRSAAHFATARKLLRDGPNAVDCRKAVSAAYYGLFHHICAQFSGIVLHPVDQDYARASLQAYRYLDHGSARQRCVDTRDVRRKFPQGIIAFASAFIELQQQRILADYDPVDFVSETFALELIELAEAAMTAFDAEPEEARRAFVIFVALKPKNRT